METSRSFLHASAILLTARWIMKLRVKLAVNFCVSYTVATAAHPPYFSLRSEWLLLAPFMEIATEEKESEGGRGGEIEGRGVGKEEE